MSKVSESQNVRFYWALCPKGNESLKVKHMMVHNFRLTSSRVQDGMTRIKDLAGLQAEAAATDFLKAHQEKFLQACVALESKFHSTLPIKKPPAITRQGTYLGKRPNSQRPNDEELEGYQSSLKR